MTFSELDKLFRENGLYAKINDFGDGKIEVDYFVGSYGNGKIWGEVFRLWKKHIMDKKLVVFNELCAYGNNIRGDFGEEWLFAYVPNTEMKAKGFTDNVWSYDLIEKDGCDEVKKVIKSVIKQFKEKMNELKLEKIKEDF